MTDNEIIKALEWLIFNFPKIENPKDDSDKLSNCINLYCQNAVDELKRQKAEIERLQTELEFKCDNCENIRLSREEYRKAISQAETEAIKEFAEWLKNNCDIYNVDYPYGCSLKVINNLANEMVGDVHENKSAQNTSSTASGPLLLEEKAYAERK